MKGTIIAAVVIAAAILFSGGVPWVEAQRTGPWQMQVSASQALAAWRINTMTGDMELCVTNPQWVARCNKVPSP